MRINSNEFEFTFKGKKITKNWSEVEIIRKYWIVVPPLYFVRFENEKRAYFFNTRYFCIVTPIYVIDISSMGDFIRKRRKDIPLLKELRKEKITPHNKGA